MVKPKKSLGQNFLKDSAVLEKIIAAADLKPDDNVFEIGPGEGVLTEKLIEKAGKVISVEKDNHLALRLDSRFPASPAGGRGNDKIKIINDDILKVNLEELISSVFHNLTPSPSPRQSDSGGQASKGEGGVFSYKLVANIPYYITSPIIRLFLETKYPPSEMILMVQKEVAERICAKPGKMSILAVSVQYYSEPELLFYVGKESFWPVPEVDSAVIKITPYDLTPSPPRQPHPNLPLNTGEGEYNSLNFFRIVKAGFSAKRKTLLNNLSSSLHLEKKIVEEKIKKAGLGPTQRAQELSVEDWKKMADCFK